MSPLRRTTWSHGSTGERLPDPEEVPNRHAVHAKSYVHAPAPLPGLEGLPDGARLVIGSAREALARGLDRERLREAGALLGGSSEGAAGGTLPTIAAVPGHSPLTATAVHTAAIGAEARELVSRVRACIAPGTGDPT